MTGGPRAESPLFRRLVLLFCVVGLLVLVGQFALREVQGEPSAVVVHQEPVKVSGATAHRSSVDESAAVRTSLDPVARFGVVDDATGRPVPGASFARVGELKSSYTNSEWQSLGYANESGVFEARVADLGTVGGILVDSARHAPAYIDLASLVADCEVRLSGGYAIKARCLTLDGEPLPGVMVGIMRSFPGAKDPAVARRPGPNAGLPMTWAESATDGSVAFPALASGSWHISARHPTHAMVAAPDSGLLRIPIEDFELRFAPLYVCMANTDPSLGAKVTFEYRPSKGRWRVDNSLASQHCTPLAAELREKFSAAVVAVAAVDLRHGLPEPIEGRILTEAGWHRFRAGWRPLSEVGGPWLMEAEPVPPRVEWGEVEVFVVGRDGRPLDLGPGSSLAVGSGPMPSFQTSYRIGTRRKVPVGTYRLITPSHPFFSDAIAGQAIIVRKGELTSEVVHEPNGLVRVQFDLQVRNRGQASSGGIQIRHGKQWQTMGVWTPGRSVYYVPLGPMIVNAVALGSEERVNQEVVVHDATATLQIITIELQD